MTSGNEASALKTWATVLGFLALLMVALGGVAYVMKTMAAANRPPHAQTEARH